MRKPKSGVLVLLFCAAFVVLPVSSVQAQWIEDGVSLCMAAEGQSDPTIVSDGEGGAIVTWRDNRGGNYDIYAQRVDASGAVQWTTDGVALCTAVGSQQDPTIIPDGAGGAIVSWCDYRGADADIYAQRVDASGAVQWTIDGEAICTATGNQQYPTVASDGAGGAIVTWRDSRGGDWDVYAQRVNASGSVQWTIDGEAICTSAGVQYSPRITSDGAGGAVITWYDFRGGVDYDIYAQRVDASGSVQWTIDGEAICTATGNQSEPKITSDGAGGGVVTWDDERSGTLDIYAQRVDASGSVRWTTDGVALCTETGDQMYPAVFSDGVGGAVVTWQDLRSGTDYDIYAQLADASGAVQWTTGGVALCTETGDQRYPAIASDGAGGAIVAWSDKRAGDEDIYTQRVDASGAIQWATDGVGLCTAAGTQTYPTIASDRAGGAIVTWPDYRSGTADIYAQRVTRQGYWGYPAPRITSVQDVPGDQGGRVRLSFSQSRLDAWPDLAITHYSIWRALYPSAALAMKASGTSLPNPSQATAALVGKAYYSSSSGDWELIGTMEAHLWSEYGYTAATLRDSTSVDQGWEYYRVSAHGGGSFDFWDSAPDSGYSVDNLSPCAPAALAAEYIGESQLYIHWKPNTETDLSHYAVYRGTSPDFVPDETNRVGTATDSSFVDDDFGYGEYYYKLSAWDVHENESPFSLLTPDMIAGTPWGDRRYSNFLFQNAPNPFLSSTRIAFSTKEEAHVRLIVFDARGRMVRMLVDGIRKPSRYVEEWDGRDDSGRRLSSGTYFYLLELPGWSDSRKMTLVR